MVNKAEKKIIKERGKSLSKIPQKTFDKEAWKPKTGIGKPGKKSSKMH